MNKLANSKLDNTVTESTRDSVGRSTLLRSGFWYTVCNFLFKTATFLATPIFSRVLSVNEMGEFTNFNSWLLIMIVLTGFDLQQTIILSKVENEKDMDSYVFSILFLTTVATGVFLALVLLFPSFFVDLFNVELKYIYLMVAYLLFTPAFQMYATKHRVYYKYKSYVLLTGLVSILAVLLSIVLIFLLEDKLTGRMLGNYLPYILLGAVLYLLLAIRGKRIRLCYWKSSMMICLPLVPHVLSLFLLSSSSKIIITKLCGTELTAIYGIAYIVYNVTTVLFDSMNKAWAPWLIENLHLKNYYDIKQASRIYILIFFGLALGVLLLTPEIVRFLGGEQYAGAVYCVAPLICSCIFQCVYTMYVNIEFYNRQTMMVSAATVIAMGVNILLNYVLIPLDPAYGHVIASYTTLCGYVLLFIMHFFLVKRLKMTHVYDTRFVLLILMLAFVVSLLVNLLYHLTLIRYLLIALFLAIAVMLFWCYRHIALHFFHKRQK